MKLFITGGTGFIGQALVPGLIGAGHEAVLLVRPGEKVRFTQPSVSRVEGNPKEPGPWWREVAACDGAINMAGSPIFGRWTGAVKKELVESRVKTTENLVAAIPEGKPFRLLSTSAVGVYGDAGERILDETAPPGSDFLARLAVEWEARAMEAAKKGASVAITRFGIVLGPGGGALEQLVKNTLRFAGGPVGGGRQYFSWIHIDDLVAALLWLLDRPEITGPVNLSSPNPLTQGESAKILGRILHRPAITPAPAFAVRLLLGEFADVVLFSQRMTPKRLLEAGFSYSHPDFGEAVGSILAK